MSAAVLQAVVDESPRGRVVAVDSAYDARPENRGRDVVVNASYCGVLPARFVAEHAPRGAIGVDCGIGPDGAGIAGLWFLEALGIPAATAAIDTVVLGDGVEMHRSATVSRVNAVAERCGVAAGMPVREAARLLLDRDPVQLAPSEVTRRTVVDGAHGREVVCTDSIAFGLPEDRGRTVLVTAGHTGRSAVPYLRRVAPWGFICSDGGGGRDDSGTAGLREVEADGLAGAAVDARTARMGDGRSTYDDGVISACNEPAHRRGVRVGQSARQAARLLLADDPTNEAPR
ncbi:unannotated protein [freshwater metagenome]|uniref:Unannotated protein n=1 Tax=freshwater metagenome TaxID=449393 RepID=A0A6J7GQI2_9ZZZZ|nr:hypothetical protein [Actinomycetota bacterium]